MIIGKRTTEIRKNMCKSAVAEIRKQQYVLDNVREAAASLQKEYNVKGPFPIVNMIIDAGFKIYSQNLKQGIGGYIIISNDIEDKFGTDKIIVVNENENKNRQRFSLAHEFGHYLLDPLAKNVPEYYNAFESDDDTTDIETLVNRFAAELLLPADDFIRKYQEVRLETSDLYEIFKKIADYFAVPSTSVQKRFSEVGISL